MSDMAALQGTQAKDARLQSGCQMESQLIKAKQRDEELRLREHASDERAAVLDDRERAIRLRERQLDELEKMNRHSVQDRVDARLQQVIEREALLAVAEERIRRSQDSWVAEQEHDNLESKRRWDALRKADRDLVARRMELQSVSDAIRRRQQEGPRTTSAADANNTSKNPSAGGYEESKGDIAALMQRVREREVLLRKIGEHARPNLKS